VFEITPIPAPAGSSSDVRVYYAVVKIDSPGFAELRPGLSAEVKFLVESKPTVTRVPIQAIRWIYNKPYVVVPSKVETKENATNKTPSILFDDWRSVTLGLSDMSYFEVLSGLKPGEKIVARPELLIPPPTIVPPPSLAVTNAQPRE